MHIINYVQNCVNYCNSLSYGNKFGELHGKILPDVLSWYISPLKVGEDSCGSGSWT
jgi:hypothetical protein